MENPPPEKNWFFYYHICQHAPVGIFVYDSNPNLIFCNPKVYQMLGISPKNISLALKHGFENDRLNDSIRAVLNGETRKYEGTLSSLYGNEYPYVKIEFQRIEVEAENMVYCIGIIENMTEQRQIFKELTESKEILQHFVENLQIGFAILDGFNDQILYASPAISTILGTSVDKYDSIADIVKKAEKSPEFQQIRQEFEDFKFGKPIDLEFRIPNAQNQVRWIHLKSFQDINPSDVSYHVTVILEDITQKKNIQDMLLQSQKLESIGRLAAGISHDFNNIIGAIFANAELGLIDQEEQQLTPEKAKEYFEGIINLGTRAKELTNKLLYFSQQGRYNLQSINLNDTVKEIVKLFAKEVGSKSGVTFETDLQSNVSIFVQINQIQQLIQNLLSNAREAMIKGGKIVVRTYDSYISPKIINTYNEISEDRYVVLEVNDQGRGIKEEDLPKLFDPFFTTKKQNTGLGLAAAWGVLKSHNAFVDVYSKVNEGTKIRVFFPILETARVVSEFPSDEGIGSGGVLLIVDDEIEIAELTARYLRTRNYTVFTAPNGEEALRIFDDVSPPIDMVITDMVMHPVDGAELFYKIKEKKPDLPIYIMSGYFRDSRLQDLLEHGASGIISKPFSLRNLEKEIRKYFYSKKK